MRVEAKHIMVALLVVLFGAVVWLGTKQIYSVLPGTETATANVERELARLNESIRQLSVVKEEAFLRRDILQAQYEIAKLASLRKPAPKPVVEPVVVLPILPPALPGPD